MPLEANWPSLATSSIILDPLTTNTHAMQLPRVQQIQQQQQPRGASLRAAATPAARYAKAAAKYNTGPTSPALLYQRVDLASLLDMDVSEAVRAHSSRAAQDPQTEHKRAAQQQGQQEDNERVNWNEIL